MSKPTPPDEPSAERIDWALSKYNYKYFGDYPLSEDEQEAVSILAAAATYLRAAKGERDDARGELAEEIASADSWRNRYEGKADALIAAESALAAAEGERDDAIEHVGKKREELKDVRVHADTLRERVVAAESALVAAEERAREQETEWVALVADVREWLCEACNTVYPGPQAEGVWCVCCPKCGGLMGPRRGVEARAFKAQRDLAERILTEVFGCRKIGQGWEVWRCSKCGSLGSPNRAWCDRAQCEHAMAWKPIPLTPQPEPQPESETEGGE